MSRSKFEFNKAYVPPAGKRRRMPMNMKELREKLKKIEEDKAKLDTIGIKNCMKKGVPLSE